MLSSILPIVPADSADATSESEETPFFETIADLILDSFGDISDSIVTGIDDIPLPPGSTSIISAVTEDEVSVTEEPVGDVDYTSDTPVDKLCISGGSSITVRDGVTVTVGTLYILSSETPAELNMEGTGKMVINGLVVCGLPVLMPSFTIQTSHAGIMATYDNHGGSLLRDFSLSISDFTDFTMIIGGHTVDYTSASPSGISISVKTDLTDYLEHVAVPNAISTIDKLVKYIGSLVHIQLEVDIRVDATYSEDSPTEYEVGGLHLHMSTPEYSIGPYTLGVSLAKVKTYPVDIQNISLEMTIPSNLIGEDKSLMDLAGYFVLSADSIGVERVLPDEPLSVEITDMGIELGAAPEPNVELRLGSMSYQETVTDSTGTYDMGTEVSGFVVQFTGTSSDLLDNPVGLIKSIFLNLAVVEGTFTMGHLDYQKADHSTHELVEGAEINDLVFRAKLALTQFWMHFDIGPFKHTNPDGELVGSSIGYDLRFGIDPSIDPSSISGIMDLLKLLSLKSTAEIRGEGPDFNLDAGRRFIIGFATEGLRIINGDDSVIFDWNAITGLMEDGDVVITFHRMSGAEINEKIPSGLRQQLNGGCVVELTNSRGITEYGGDVTVTVNAGLNPKNAGAYLIDTGNNKIVKEDAVIDGGTVTFKANVSGMYAVSGALLEPSKVTAAIVLFAFAMLLGAITAVVYRWH